MSTTNNQDGPIVIGQPIEIANAVNEIRKQLAVLPWIDHPFFIAEKFYKKKDGRSFTFPETYAPTKPGSMNYHRLTPDNDFDGMFFFVVGDGKNDFQPNRFNYLTYPIGIVFSVNLKRIDQAKLDQGLFTMELVSQARRILTNTMIVHDFQYNIISETRDLRNVFREFSMDDIESYNRAPMQCWRFNLDVMIQEECE